MTESIPLTQRETAGFFFPLLLNVQMMSVSHSIINAGLARMDDAINTLAAFSIAMVLHLFVASPSYQNHTVTIAMVRDRNSLMGTILFVSLVAIWVSTLLALIAFTPVGEFVLIHLLGVSPIVAEGACDALSLLVLLPFITGPRGLFQGLVIQARRTSLVSFATGIRIFSLFGYLWLGSLWFEGTRVAAFALLFCVLTETVVIGIFAWKVHLPPSEEPQITTGAILRFAFPLAYSSGLQQAVPLMINALISRLPDGTLALAAFGVIRGFLFMLAGPMRNLQQAYLTLVRQPLDYPQLVHFFYKVSIGMAIIMLIVAWPGNHWILGRVMGLDDGMRHYIAWPMAACALFPLLYGAANLLRGWFAGAHLTSHLGRSTVYKVIMLCAFWPILSYLPPWFSGITVAVFLLLAAELCEAWYLRIQRDRLLDDSGLVPMGPLNVK